MYVCDDDDADADVADDDDADADDADGCGSEMR